MYAGGIPGVHIILRRKIMNNIVKINFNQKDETNGVRQMFAFAADDYRGKTGKTAQIAIGGILEESDTEETIKEFVSGAISNCADLIIFDINHVSNNKVKAVLDLFRINEFGFKEIPNVYEDRIVFGKM
jgi:hypothetical protein